MSRQLYQPADVPVDSKHLSEYLQRELPRLTGSVTWDPDLLRPREISATVTMVMVLDDRLGGVVKGNNSITSVFVIDPTSAVAWPIGTCIRMIQWGTGLCQVSGSGAATILTPSSANFSARYAEVRALHIETDQWVLSGGLA